MTEQDIKWNNTCSRFVAFLDIMGFKDMVYRKEHKIVLGKMYSFQPAIDLIKKDAELRMKAKWNENTDFVWKDSIINAVTFSDSILLVSNNDSIDALYNIIFNVQWTYWKAIQAGIPVKGAIAYGEQTADLEHSLHFGKPLIDAFELQSELFLYGIAIHHTTEEFISHNVRGKLTYNPFYLCQYLTPLKTCKVNHYIVGIPKYQIDEGNVEKMIIKLYNTVSGDTRLYVDNTLSFVRWFLAEQIKLSEAELWTRSKK